MSKVIDGRKGGFRQSVRVSLGDSEDGGAYPRQEAVQELKEGNSVLIKTRRPNWPEKREGEVNAIRGKMPSSRNMWYGHLPGTHVVSSSELRRRT